MGKSVKNSGSRNKGRSKSKTPLWIKIIAVLAAVGFILYLVLPGVFQNSREDKEYMFRKDGELTITDFKSGKIKAALKIQIAETEFDRELGLMFRKHMEENRGMLFIFPEATIQSFWMRNTLIPLDMIFIDADKKIVTIRKDTKTLSDETYISSEPAKYVLEVNAGYTDANNIRTGDIISYSKD